MTTPLRVALVGYGFAAKVFHAPLIRAVDGLTLHTVVSSRPEQVHADLPEVHVVGALDDVCADPQVDLVVIATPNTLHAPQALQSLAAGKHVVVDKPFTISVPEAEQVIDAALQHGRLLSVFHNRRWDADFRTLRQLIADGELGEVTQFESHFDRFRLDVRDRWRERAAPGAGLWYDLGPHLVDQALVLFGRPLAISADLAMQRAGAQSDDYFHVTLRYPRARVLLHASTLVADHSLRLAVHGTGGSYVKHGMDSQEDALKAGGSPRDAGWGADPHPGWLTRVTEGAVARSAVPGVPGAYASYYAQICDAIAGRAANPVPASEALAVMQLIEAGLASARERREVALA